MATKEKAQEIFQLLTSHYPHAKMILQWRNNFELLVAIILSAQCTDKKVNEVTAAVFPKYQQKSKELEDKYANYSRMIITKGASSSSEQRESRSKRILKQVPDDAEFSTSSNKKDSGPQYHSVRGRQARMTTERSFTNVQDDKLDSKSLIQLVNFAYVPLTELEQDIKSTGFYHAKAKSVRGAAITVLEKFNGIIPKTIAELTTIPGVGRKTANVFLTNAYHIDEGIAVDTHVKKQAKLLGLTRNTDPVKIEKDLMQLFPQGEWHNITYMLIEHGRNMRKKKSDQVICNDFQCILCNSK